MAASPATPSLAERAEEGDGGTEWFYERGDAANPDRARESERLHRNALEPEPEDLSACWHASRSDGVRFGPVDVETLACLLMEAEAAEEARGAGGGVETLVWHPRENAAWGPAAACPSLAYRLAVLRREDAASRAAAKTSDAALEPAAFPRDDARETRAASASSPTAETRLGTTRARRVADGDFERRERSRLEALEAELAETREALGSARFEIDALEAELASTRERAAEATAFAREAARAAEATEDLSAARVELETKTAELSRLRGVLKGKLLARVLAEMDDTRERVVELDELDARDAREGAW